VIFLPNKALSTKNASQTAAESVEEAAIDLAEAEVGAATTGAGVLEHAGAGQADQPEPSNR
jgi:hypothetical protein